MKDSNESKIKVLVLEEEICRFDVVLDHIQRLMPEDLKVYRRIVEARDAVFRLQQQMRGLDIVDFCTGGGVS